jgi:MoxR-like ATPase
VLIDEIDKAPRDFPNDLLYEIESMRFRIPELSGDWIRANDDLRPIVVMTSNSEKHLPAAFLRRCVYYHIDPPTPDRLRRIVARRLEGVVEVDLDAREEDDRSRIGLALSLFSQLREPRAGLEKRPSTSELLAWLRVLAAADGDPFEDADRIMRNLVTLVKNERDREASQSVVKAWLSSHARP